MASTLLAVDDSVTMRKVLEDTFPGPEFRVDTANGPDAALQKLSADRPDVILVDGALEPRNGYELCKEIKRLAPGTPVLLLSSKQNPFDAIKGAGAQVDEHLDKPFDTQELIEKVRKLLLAAQPGELAKNIPTTTTSPSATFERTPAPPPVANGTPSPGAVAPLPPVARAKTLIYNPEPVAPGEASKAPPAPVPVAPIRATATMGNAPAAPTFGTTASMGTPSAAGAMAPEVAAPVPAADASTDQAVAHAEGNGASTNGAPAKLDHATADKVDRAMTGKLETLGLTAAQIDAVLSLSREVVERAVWEVVPLLAETLIKEEIARLTR